MAPTPSRAEPRLYADVSLSNRHVGTKFKSEVAMRTEAWKLLMRKNLLCGTKGKRKKEQRNRIFMI